MLNENVPVYPRLSNAHAIIISAAERYDGEVVQPRQHTGGGTDVRLAWM